VIVLDTTVLVYAKGDDHPLRSPCRRLVEAAVSGGLSVTTTPEVIQEFAHVRARRRGRKDAAALARAYADVLAPLITIEEPHLRAGLLLYERYPDLGAFDAVLAASASLLGAEALVSADRAFGVLDFPRHVVPDDDGVRSLLAPSAGS
jgi:predicted nucleic acid-binding protein